MRRKIWFAVGLALLSWALVIGALHAAFAAPACMSRADILAQLGKDYSEAPVGVGAANGNLLELARSKDGSTWSIIGSEPNGCSYLLLAGEDWIDREWAAPVLPGEAL